VLDLPSLTPGAWLATYGSVAVVCLALASCNGGNAAGGGSPGGGSPGGGGAAGSSSSLGFVSGVGSGMGPPPDAGCGGSDAAPPDSADASTGCEGLEGGVSYANDVAHILAGCQGEECHLSPSRATLVDVPAYECCDGRLLVAPGSAAQSYLVDKIQGHDLCLGGRMPLDLPPLPASEILAIRRWVCEGAPDN
jgi:hypothetical protein